jgi:hypothetical protein
VVIASFLWSFFVEEIGVKHDAVRRRFDISGHLIFDI